MLKLNERSDTNDSKQRKKWQVTGLGLVRRPVPAEVQDRNEQVQGGGTPWVA